MMVREQKTLTRTEGYCSYFVFKPKIKKVHTTTYECRVDYYFTSSFVHYGTNIVSQGESQNEAYNLARKEIRNITGIDVRDFKRAAVHGEFASL